MDRKRLYYLLEQELLDLISDAEARELYDLKMQPDQPELVEAIAKLIEREAARPVYISDEKEVATFNKIIAIDLGAGQTSHDMSVRRMTNSRRWYWAAASVLLITATLILFVNRTSEESSLHHTQRHDSSMDRLPGKNGAVLTLADGRTMVLDSLANGQVAEQQGTKILLQDGQVAYNVSGQPDETVAWNILSTPKGRQFRLVLPDGTRVWLNAASSLQYPAAFTGRERRVKITGEAYFEVVKNKHKTFVVDVDGKSSVEVLGTQFNVNAYRNEVTARTTLIEGAIKVTSQLVDVRQGKATVILQPGQQAQIVQESAAATAAPITITNNTDLEKVMAWKNGLFVIEGAGLPEFMREVERWYDIDVRYEGNIPSIHFKGKLDRGVRLSSVLNWLSALGIQSRLEGTTVILTGN